MLVAIRAGLPTNRELTHNQMELPFQAHECDYAELDHLFQLYTDGKFQELRTRIETYASSRIIKALFIALAVTTANNERFKSRVANDLSDKEVLYHLYQRAAERDAQKQQEPLPGPIKLEVIANEPSGELKEDDADDSGSSTSGGDLIHYCGNSPCSFCDPDYDLPEAQ